MVTVWPNFADGACPLMRTIGVARHRARQMIRVIVQNGHDIRTTASNVRTSVRHSGKKPDSPDAFYTAAEDRLAFILEFSRGRSVWKENLSIDDISAPSLFDSLLATESLTGVTPVTAIPSSLDSKTAGNSG